MTGPAGNSIGPTTTSAKAAPATAVLTASDIGGDPTSGWGRVVDGYAQKINAIVAQMNDPSTVDSQRLQLQANLNSLTTVYNSAVEKMVTNATGQQSKTSTLDAATKADAAAALAYQAANQKVPVKDESALNRWLQSGGTLADLQGAATSGDNSPVGQAIDAATNDPRVQQAMRLGALLEGGSLSGNFGTGDQGNSFGPYQINHANGMHSDISISDSQDPVKATQYMLSAYQAAVDQVPQSLWQSDPQAAAAQAVYLAEKPAAMYPADRVQTAWNQIQSAVGGMPQARGNLVWRTNPDGTKTPYEYNPSTGAYQLAKGLPSESGVATKPETKQVTNPDGTSTTWERDTTSGKWAPAKGLPSDAAPNPTTNSLPNVQNVMAKYASDVQFIVSQAKAGAFGTDPVKAQQLMGQYLTAAGQVRDAALQGATPMDLMKQQEAFATAQATLGQNMIKDRMDSGRQLAQSLVTQADQMAQHSFHWDPSYNPLTYARLETEQASGGQSMADLAKSLVSGIANPGGSTTPPPGAAGATPGALPPLSGLALQTGAAAQPAAAPAAAPAAVGSVAGQQAAGHAAVGSVQGQQQAAGGSALAQGLAAGLSGTGPTNIQHLINPVSQFDQAAQPVSGGALLL